MADGELLLDLLAEWEERRQRGEVLSAEQLCPGDPSLQEELRQRIHKRQKLLPIMEPAATLPAEAGVELSLPRIKGYEILNILGTGGMGVVYKARQVQLNRIVALKMIHTGTLSRFESEARAIAGLQHPGIVQLFEYGEQDGRPFLALEFVSGGSLADHLQARPLPPHAVAELVRALAVAVEHAHQKGIVHRDLKPANVLLASPGRQASPGRESGEILPKIADFGLAKHLDADQGATRTGAVLGSPSYMAPEQAEGRKEVTPATDIYALGAILYECLTGRPPFQGTTVLETLEHVRVLPPVPPRALQPGVPRDLETVCLKCLEKRPEDRYPSAGELADELTRFLHDEPVRAHPPGLFEHISRTLRRNDYSPMFRRYSGWLLGLSPFPLLIHLAVYGLFHDSERYPVLITLTSLAVVVLVQVAMSVALWPTLLQVPPRQHRHFLTVWGADLAVAFVTWLLLWRVLPPEPPELLFLVYPLWLLQVGLAYAAFASEAGGFYVTGAAFVTLAILLTFALPWAPILLGFIMFFNMTIHGLILRQGRPS